MTELLIASTHSLVGRFAFDPIMPDNTDDDWQHHYMNQFPMLNAQWPQHVGPQSSGVQQLDLSMLDHDSHGYMHPYDDHHHHHHHHHHQQHPFQSPNMAYMGSDMDTAAGGGGSPSTPGFPDMSDPMSRAYAPAPSHHHLSLPTHPFSTSMRSPRSSPSGLSPHEPSPQPAAIRPPLGHRSVTAPVPPVVKHHSDEDFYYDDDDDYIPPTTSTTTQQDASKRGRTPKRQRIPHTAVERRYRENLNAHLDKLRHAVPAFNAPARKGGGGGVEGVKPSKCEVLNGAIEHIGALERQCEELRRETLALRARLEQVQGGWVASR